ncbi:type II toxin-antitoxin system RelE/ParE family toxin [Desulfomicrobium sp. ZS1]|uniref:type II toxin-antitoxin system RelE/ParE family toxin n=1 Tax=Desulfomicrobium sp. ZS1 TaxID=2952228 RepID=UPI002112BEFF|nr:type II toxin-antitoxin system RelE/ParE family toxin [Desulfomicrobium sp. ZS1]
MSLTKVRWARNAIKDLERIRIFLEETADSEVMLFEAQRIWESCQRLRQFPESGRPGRIAFTREVVVSPYVIPYRVKKSVVEILNIFHSAQKR